jgi:hypothetical protein
MADDRRDDTNPPPPPRRAERAGSVRLGTGAGIPPERIREAVRRENALDLDPVPTRERARVSVTERTHVERGEPQKSNSSGTMRAIKDRWTPQNIASAAGILVSILATAGITKGCNNEAHTQEIVSAQTAKILTAVEAVDAKITKESAARRLNDKAHDLQIIDLATLTSYLNQGEPNDGWPTKSDGWDTPSIGSDRAPRFKINRGLPGLVEADTALREGALREQ